LSTVHVAWPAHLILLDFIIVIILLIMQLSPTSCHFISLSSKYCPQHHDLKHPRPLHLP
jgi:hypothetical protein